MERHRDNRAECAEQAVRRRFGGRLLGIPGTHLGRIWAPAGPELAPFVVPATGPLNYWWQAHYLDAIVDAGLRQLRDGDHEGAASRARLGHRMLFTLRVRNGGSLTNHFFDDMAWLALAVGRLAALDEQLGRTVARGSLRPVQRLLARELSSGIRPEGGVHWNRDRCYVPAAAASPVALAAARAGHRDLARQLLDWVMTRLLDQPTGLVADGVRPHEHGEDLETTAFTYNQGTTLALLLELGETDAAALLVAAIAQHLTVEVGTWRVLTAAGGGDGGLFAGILARYLAMAACHPELDPSARRLARELVSHTADALWARAEHGVFPEDPAQPHPLPARVELSTQVSAWMTLEAAAVCAEEAVTRE